MKSFTVVPVLLLLLVAAVEAAPPPPPTAWSSPGLNCEFKIFEDASTEVSMCLKDWLYTYNTCLVEGHPFLYKQTLTEKPPLLLFQKLHGWGLDWTNLAIRPDNLYLLGFANGAGTWYSFKPQSDQYKIPGAVPLSIGTKYGDLLGYRSPGSWFNLIQLDLSKKSISGAVSVLYNYDPLTTTDAVLQEAVAKLVVFVCESTRFPYILDLIVQGFDQNSVIQLGYLGAKLIVNWKEFSCAILIWNMDKLRWDSVEAINLGQLQPAGFGIANIQEALAQIYPILQPVRCSVKYQEQPVCN